MRSWKDRRREAMRSWKGGRREVMRPWKDGRREVMRPWKDGRREVMRPWKGGRTEDMRLGKKRSKGERRGQVTETVALTLGNSSIWRILSRGPNFPKRFTLFPQTAVEGKKRCSSTCFDAIAVIQAWDGSSLEPRTGDKVVKAKWNSDTFWRWKQLHFFRSKDERFCGPRGHWAQDALLYWVLWKPHKSVSRVESFTSLTVACLRRNYGRKGEENGCREEGPWYLNNLQALHTTSY